MLNAIAKMTTDAVGAVADTVTDVLPLPGKDHRDDTTEPADADVARDQDSSKGSSDKKAKPSKDQSEGPVSRPIETTPTISGDLDIPIPETSDKDTSEDAGPTFETTEKQTSSQGKDEVVTHSDDVEVPEASTQQEAPVAKSAGGDKKSSGGDKKQADKKQAGGRQGKKTESRQDLAPATHTETQIEPAGKSSSDSSSQSSSFTAGSQPLPKMSPGRTKWMKSSSMWYPDRSGVLHAPGFYINRKPRSNFMNPMNKVEVSI